MRLATVVGTLRYDVISVEEGASVYSDLHCTKADQKLVDKISHLKKIMKQGDLNTTTSLVVENKETTIEKPAKPEQEKKKKRSFFS